MADSYYLLTGAAGYVGSHVLRLLLERGKKCVALDNLAKGHREAVPPEVPFFEGDVKDETLLSQIIHAYPISGILHFAGYIEVGESMKNPGKYFENNLACGLPLLEATVRNKIRWIVFSSSAAVYGQPEETPIRENTPKKPNNPYGLTKWAFEKMLEAYDAAYGLRYISLRYFNASGAHPSGELGEDHRPESHLIPLACKAALGKTEFLSIYGDDYPTQDGTCIRDYIHISDLAFAHLLAASALEQGMLSDTFNLGSEGGYSVKKVAETVRKISGKKIPLVMTSRRPGDSAVLVASSQKFRSEFSWKPEYPSLEKIVESAWKWHESHPDGFKAPGVKA